MENGWVIKQLLISSLQLMPNALFAIRKTEEISDYVWDVTNSLM
jgi:hypothetical protein